MVHGDNFLTEGCKESLKRMDEALKKEFMIKTEVPGPDASKGQAQQIRLLNRVITWEDGGTTWEPDPRHVEFLLEQMGLTNASPLKIPGVKPTKEQGERKN